MILTIHQGRPAVEVEDGKGKTALYWFRRLGNRVTLIRVDGARESRVSKSFPSLWSCSCKGFMFSKRYPRSCKHIGIAQELIPLLDAMCSETASA